LALTVLGTVIAVLGLFGAAVPFVIAGLLAIFGAGVLQVMGSRKS